MLTAGCCFCVSGLCQQDAVHITAILGESVVFNCHVEFPGEHPVPYVLQWEKKVGDTVRYRTTPSALYIRELKTGALLENATPLVSAEPLLFYRDDLSDVPGESLDTSHRAKSLVSLRFFGYARAIDA